jgi:hypothetical protein
MNDDRNRQITPSKGFWGDLTDRARLILRLIGDPRVSPWLKLLPIGSLVYLVVPDLAIGPIDDAAVLWLGTYLFVEMCPPEIVDEHKRLLAGQAQPIKPDPLDNKEEIIDAEYWEAKDK